MDDWSHFVPLIVAIVGFAMAAYVMLVQRRRTPLSREEQLEHRVAELETTVHSLQRVIVANQKRITELETELLRERQARQILDGQLAFYAAAMSGMDPKKIDPHQGEK